MPVHTLRARCQLGILSAVLALLVLAGDRRRRPPRCAQPDTIAAARAAGTQDVLGNDSDPDVDALSVSANSQGANGSVQGNSAMGACLYTATGGFTGTDSFTYTARRRGRRDVDGHRDRHRDRGGRARRPPSGPATTRR